VRGRFVEDKDMDVIPLIALEDVHHFRQLRKDLLVTEIAVTIFA
jgi:hypothetical protein